MPSFLTEFRDVLARGDDLPTLPTVVLELHAALDDEHAGAADIARIIERDPALVTRFLRIANSAAFNRGSPVGSVNHAVQLIGLKMVGTLCLALSVVNAFSSRRGGLGHRTFWRHCGAVAHVARLLAAQLGYRAVAPDQIYVGGLLHDIGLLMLDQFFPEWMQRSIAEAYAQECPLHRAEDAVMGVDHGEIGSLLLGCWSVPRPICAMVGSHHQPASGAREYRDACWIIYSAEMICSHSGLGLSIEGIEAERAASVVDILREEIDLESVLAQMTDDESSFVVVD